MPARHRRGQGAVLVLLGLSGCSSPHLPERASDSSRVVAASTEPPRAPAPAQAGTPLRVELEQRVGALESEDPPRPLGEEEFVAVLEYYCGQCHFPRPGSEYFDGLFYMNDLSQLILTGKVTPGEGEGSRLVQRVRKGEMPPVTSGYAPMPSATLDRIVEFIDGLPSAIAEPAAPVASEPPWLEEARQRPSVPPVEAQCFEYLGDWIRCENDGSGSDILQFPGRDLDFCFATCRERPDCVAVTDYTWLDRPDLGCYLYLSSCDAPATGSWHEEDGGRQYRKTCARAPRD